jgi:D-alanyl-lipoteichoic acid acyltransferase DltB (MBOAT superfamily)
VFTGVSNLLARRKIPARVRFLVYFFAGVALDVFLSGWVFTTLHVAVVLLNFGLIHLTTGTLQGGLKLPKFVSVIVVTGTNLYWLYVQYTVDIISLLNISSAGSSSSARWTVQFGGYFLTLRLLSYAADRIQRVYGSTYVVLTQEKHTSTCETCLQRKYCAIKRRDQPVPPGQFNVFTYLGYVFYPPLFAVGPILTFAGFMSHFDPDPGLFPAYQQEDKINSTLHWCWLLAFTVLTQQYTNISLVLTTAQWPPVPVLSTPMYAFAIAFVGLSVFILKAQVIWRYFRLWALFNNIETPVNVTGQVVNYTTTSAACLAWHSSLRLWMDKYVLQPLRGSDNSGWLQKVLAAIITVVIYLYLHEPSMESILGIGLPLFLLYLLCTGESMVVHIFKQVLDRPGSKFTNVRATGTAVSLYLFMMLITMLYCGYEPLQVAYVFLPDTELPQTQYINAWLEVFRVMIFLFCGAHLAQRSAELQLYDRRLVSENLLQPDDMDLV